MEIKIYSAYHFHHQERSDNIYRWRARDTHGRKRTLRIVRNDGKRCNDQRIEETGFEYVKLNRNRDSINRGTFTKVCLVPILQNTARR